MTLSKTPLLIICKTNLDTVSQSHDSGKVFRTTGATGAAPDEAPFFIASTSGTRGADAIAILLRNWTRRGPPRNSVPVRRYVGKFAVQRDIDGMKRNGIQA